MKGQYARAEIRCQNSDCLCLCGTVFSPPSGEPALFHNTKIVLRRAGPDDIGQILETEAVAFVVCQASGLDSTTRSTDYIQLYHGSTDTVAESLDFIRECAVTIIEELQHVEVPEKTSCV